MQNRRERYVVILRTKHKQTNMHIYTHKHCKCGRHTKTCKPGRRPTCVCVCVFNLNFLFSRPPVEEYSKWFFSHFSFTNILRSQKFQKCKRKVCFGTIFSANNADLLILSSVASMSSNKLCCSKKVSRVDISDLSWALKKAKAIQRILGCL